ncbi:hypothetical protein KKB40_06625 [Patescibacteria group bacterium]|nr:hypothetical protein [Patescibacteria group bacterium]
MVINLLPQELRPKGVVLKVSGTLKKVARLSVVTLLISALILMGVFLVLSSQVSQTSDREENLRLQVKALEETEQRLFLLKDRLSKVERVMGADSAEEEIEIFKDILGMRLNGVEFEQADLEKDKVDITISVENADSLTNFFAELIGKGNFKKIELLSLQSKAESGYNVELSLVR